MIGGSTSPLAAVTARSHLSMLNRLISLSLVVVMGLSSVQAAEIQLPDIGDPSGSAISPDQERSLGESLMRRLRQQLLIMDDPLLQSYIDTLGYRLVSNSDRPSEDFTFFIVHDPSINAFAAPGGYIGVNSGLILTTESESELAAVMAHEITHVTQRHMARTYAAAGHYRMAAAIALLAAILVGGQSDQLAQAAIAGGVAASAQMQINFTRANEREADRLGIQTMAAAGYNPESMATFFERMQRTSRLYGAQPPEFLSTHPVTTTRIAEARSLARQYAPSKVRDQTGYQLMRARLRVLDDKDPQSAERTFSEAIQSDDKNQYAARYGYALALLMAGDANAARKQADQLLQTDPNRIAYVILSARIDMARGQHQTALDTFKRALLNYPGNYPLSYFYSEALLSVDKPAQARQILQDYMNSNTPNATVRKLYAQAAGASGHLAEAYRNMAEYYFLNGQTHAAIDQLTRASQLKDVDFYEASQIEARLQELKRIATDERE